MKRILSTRGSIVPNTLIASVFIGFATLASVLFVPKDPQTGTSIHIEPTELVIEKDTEFTIDVIVESDEAVNAFAGVLEFDEAVLEVASISYNTSIADLWTQEPWFTKGDGTITFAGGTTRPGGFMGKGSLLTVTFAGKNASATALSLTGTRVLKHDGLGTDAQLRTSLDALFTIKPIPGTGDVISQSKPEEIILTTDLNNDGTTTIADVSIFMLQLASQNMRSDFNNDKRITAADLSILLDARK
ncbi:hypothetical protein K2P47_04960 [Patescibacteria group bacterium]|nr:hypothetical protein [Patescibacteria group bacterium]